MPLKGTMQQSEVRATTVATPRNSDGRGRGAVPSGEGRFCSPCQRTTLFTVLPQTQVVRPASARRIPDGGINIPGARAHAAPPGGRTSPVAKAQPSPAAKRKATTKRLDDGLPVHSFRTQHCARGRRTHDLSSRYANAFTNALSNCSASVGLSSIQQSWKSKHLRQR
jgi:hypothetical protein